MDQSAGLALAASAPTLGMWQTGSYCRPEGKEANHVGVFRSELWPKSR